MISLPDHVAAGSTHVFTPPPLSDLDPQPSSAEIAAPQHPEESVTYPDAAGIVPPTVSGGSPGDYAENVGRVPAYMHPLSLPPADPASQPVATGNGFDPMLLLVLLLSMRKRF